MSAKAGNQERAGGSREAPPNGPDTNRVAAVGDAPIAATNRTRQWQAFGRACLYMSPAVFFLVAFTYIPFLRSIWLSFFVTTPTGATAHFNGINYYRRIFDLDGSGRTEYLKSILTTISFALMVVPLGITVALALAELATLKVKAIGFFRTIFTSSIAISVASASVIWALIYSPTTRATQGIITLLHLNTDSLLQHSTTALLAVAFMTMWTSLGFNFIVTLAGIQAIPRDLYESARLDGASGWNTFRFVTVPLLTPTLLFLILINTIQSFQAFTQFNVLIGNEGPSGSTNVFVYSIFTAFWKDNRYGFASAMAVVLFMILLVLTFLQYRVLDRRVHYQ